MGSVGGPITIAIIWTLVAFVAGWLFGSMCLKDKDKDNE